MERDPSGTEGQQYWQPEGQYPDGYRPTAAQPDYGVPANDPSVYNPDQYQPDAYSQSQYQQSPYYQGADQQAAYQQNPPSYSGTGNDQGYYPTQQYAQPQYADLPYTTEATAQWSAVPAYENGSDAQQVFYQNQSYQDAYYQDPSYPNPSYQNPSYQDPSYQDPGYPGVAYPDYAYAQPVPEPAEPEQADLLDGLSESAAESSASSDSPASAEPSEASALGRVGRRRGGDAGPEAPEPDGPLLPRLVAAATGRAPGTDRRAFLIRASIGGVALLVVAAAGIAVAGSGGTGAKTSGAATAAQANLASSHGKSWSAPADTVATGSSDGLVGSWITAKALVRGDGTGVSAYDVASGGKLWTVAPPAAGAVPCAMSPTVNSTGMGAVLFQPKVGANQPCTELALVDTTSGQTGWQAKIAPVTTAYGTSVMVNDTRAVAVGDAGAVGYDIASGKQSWTYGGPGKFCALAGSGTGSTLLLQSTCADTNPKQQAITLDAGSGKLNWWRGLPQNAASYTVLSATPAVISVHMADATQDTIMSFSDKGDTQATISSGQTAGRLDTTHGSFDPMPALFFQNGTMFSSLTPPDGSTTTAGVIAAITLADGRQVWQATPREKGRSALVGLDGAAAVVATEERLGQPARLGHYDLATGKESPGGGFPQGTGSLLTSSRVLYQNNFVAALPEFTTTYSSAATGFTASH